MTDTIIILNVDDNDINRYATSRILKNAGFHVQEAESGAEALRLAAQNPNLILLDVNLPDISGFDVLRTIKSNSELSSIPVIHLSASFVRAEDKVEGLEKGADGYLTRPIEPSELVATIHSVLRMRAAEEVARVMAREWQSTFDAIADAACLVDRDGKVVRCNRAMGELLGRAECEVSGQPLHAFLESILGPEMLNHVLPAQLLTRESWEVQKANRWFRVTADPVAGDGDEVSGIVYIISDITENKRLEHQLLQSQKMEGLGRLAGGIAHDYNNLLAIILGYTEMLELDIPPNSSLHSSLHAIQVATNRAATLTKQLLAFAHRQMNETKALSVNILLASMTELLKPLLGPNIEMVTALAEDAGYVQADPNQLEQVLMNLAVNARDAMTDGGKLTIKTENVSLASHDLQSLPLLDAGSYTVISVTDTGAGMSEEVMQHVFEPFYTTKEKGKGTGLGLSTCYGIVKQAGGHIEISSEVGKGTTVRVLLPRVAAVLPAEETLVETAPQRGKETLLIVEDEPLILELTVNTLRQKGYTVLAAENGVEALKVENAYSGKIDLVITDAIMPQMGGKELIEKLKVLRPSAKVLLASGYSEEGIAAQSGLPESTAFLQKPFTSRALLDTVRLILDESAAVSSALIENPASVGVLNR